MNSLSFRVYGVPMAQGSAKAFMPKGWTRPIITSTNKNLKAWRGLVASAASDAIQASGWQQSEGGLRVMADFYLPRPKALRKEKPHTKNPDLDKLIRAVGDALAGVVYRNDSQVTQLRVTKAYAAAGEAPHAVIVVTPL